MKPSSILKLIAGFGLFLAIGIIVLVNLSRPADTRLPVAASFAQIKAEIIKTSDIPDNLTEEYALYLKLSFLDNDGNKIAIPPQCMVNIKLFSPEPQYKMGVMEKLSDKWINLADSEIMENDAKIYIKSGFKQAGLEYFLSVGIEAVFPNSPSLRCDIPLYKY
ncbi:MAG: hypothetical protein HY811_04655 [Planctomycetes bacterium]|nr:hypothetical protein [Planctomycetota bacterium]